MSYLGKQFSDSNEIINSNPLYVNIIIQKQKHDNATNIRKFSLKNTLQKSIPGNRDRWTRTFSERAFPVKPKKSLGLPFIYIVFLLLKNPVISNAGGGWV